MYDDDVRAPLSLTANDRYYKVARFPTRNIKTPIVLLYGGSDSLVAIDVMLKELPPHTLAKEVPSFEHLDFLWAEKVHELVFPTVFDALKTHSLHGHGGTQTAKGLGSSTWDSPETLVPEDESIVRGMSQRKKCNDNLKGGTSLVSPYAEPPISHWKRRSYPQSASSSTDCVSISADEIDENVKSFGASWKANEKHTRGRSSSRASTRGSDVVANFGDDGISLRVGRATTGPVAQGNVSNSRKAINHLHRSVN